MDEGATSAFEHAYETSFARVLGVAERVVGDRAEAEDIAVETFIRAYVRWGRLAGRGAIEGWLVRVATNLAIDARRRRRPTGPAEATADGTSSVAERMDLVNALRGLPRRQRDVVALRYLGDMTEAEVARTLGVSIGTVKSQTSKAMKHLRKTMTTEEADLVFS